MRSVIFIGVYRPVFFLKKRIVIQQIIVSFLLSSCILVAAQPEQDKQLSDLVSLCRINASTTLLTFFFNRAQFILSFVLSIFDFWTLQFSSSHTALTSQMELSWDMNRRLQGLGGEGMQWRKDVLCSVLLSLSSTLKHFFPQPQLFEVCMHVFLILSLYSPVM